MNDLDRVAATIFEAVLEGGHTLEGVKVVKRNNASTGSLNEQRDEIFCLTTIIEDHTEVRIHAGRVEVVPLFDTVIFACGDGSNGIISIHGIAGANVDPRHVDIIFQSRIWPSSRDPDMMSDCVTLEQPFDAKVNKRFVPFYVRWIIVDTTSVRHILEPTLDATLIRGVEKVAVVLELCWRFVLKIAVTSNIERPNGRRLLFVLNSIKLFEKRTVFADCFQEEGFREGLCGQGYIVNDGQ